MFIFFFFTIAGKHWFPRPSPLTRQAPGVKGGGITIPIHIPGDDGGGNDDNDGDDYADTFGRVFFL